MDDWLNDLGDYLGKMLDQPAPARPDDDLDDDLDDIDGIYTVDDVIEDMYDNVMRWHNAQISAGADPESGLIGLPFIPWDERLDGMAAMMGNGNPDDILPPQSSSSEIIYWHDGKQVPYEVWLVARLAYLKQLQQQEQEKQPTKPNHAARYAFVIIVILILASITILIELLKRI